MWSSRKDMKLGMLKHIAIIMDGNGRWAKNQGKNRTQGHRHGAKKVREITKWCAKNELPYLTLYAFSTENWNRPKNEINFLMKLLEKYLQNEQKTYEENNICFRAIGDIEVFNSPLKNLIRNLETNTRKNTALTQILALNYGTKNEIARAFNKIIQILSNDNKKSLNNLLGQELETMIDRNLDTNGIPNVDLLIRTGGEMRLSNFLLWQASYAELFFTQTLWPDFTTEELARIINDFSRRTRRFGGL